jgi:hypothetical protein
MSDTQTVEEQAANIIDAQMSAWNGWRITDEEFHAEARKAAAEVHTLYADELARLRSALVEAQQERDEARYRPMGDNHHNAAACPYCGDLLGRARTRAEAAEQENARLREALVEWIDADERADGSFADADEDLAEIAREIRAALARESTPSPEAR